MSTITRLTVWSTHRRTKARLPARAWSGILPSILFVGALFGTCKGDDGPQGPPGPAGEPASEDTTLELDEDAPGVVLTIDELGGASGSGGAFRSGDHVSVTFEVKKKDGTPWDLAELASGRVLVSGPTFNYQ